MNTYEKNKSYLQENYPQSWEAYLEARNNKSLPQAGPERFKVPLGNDNYCSFPVKPDWYQTLHRNRINKLKNSGGALVWGLRTPRELPYLLNQLDNRPLIYVESDPQVFQQLLRKIDLTKLTSTGKLNLSFATTGHKILELAARGTDQFAPVLTDFITLVSPDLFTRLLACDTAPGPWLSLMLKEFRKNQPRTDLGQSLDKLFSPTYIYEKILDILELFLISAPGINTLYTESDRTRALTSPAPVSLVIIAWNRWDLTERCLDSVLSHPLPQVEQILVMDNNSTDETPQKLTSMEKKISRLKHVRLPENLGKPGACDAALKHVTEETIIYLDNDSVITNDNWLEILLRPFKLHPRIGATGPFGVIHDSDRDDHWVQKIWFPSLTVPVTFLAGYCLAVRKQALVEAGGWDSDRFELYGQVDLSLHWALRKANWFSVVPGELAEVQTYTGNAQETDHYDYNRSETSRKNQEIFRRMWGPKRRILNLARNNKTVERLEKQVS